MTDMATTTAVRADAEVDPAPAARIALALVAFFFALGLTIAYALRAEVLNADQLFEPVLFAQLTNAHALVMVFFCAIPALGAVFGSLLLPRAAGRRGHAFPWVGEWGWKLHLAAGALLVASIAVGAVTSRWDLVDALDGAGSWSAGLLGLSLHLMALSLVATGIHHLATFISARTDEDDEAGVLVWTFGVHGLISLAMAPVLAAWAGLFLAQTLGGAELFGLGAGHATESFARLFWFAVQGGGLMVVVAGIGLVFDVVSTSTGAPMRGASRVGTSLFVLSVLGLFAYGLPMIDSGSARATDAVSSALALAMAIPAAVLVHAFWATASRGLLRLDAAVLHAMGFVVQIALVSACGLALASLATGSALRDSAFATAQIHLLFAGCGLAAFFAAAHRYWPALTRRALDDRLGAWGAALIFAGVQLAFLPRLVLGAQGAAAVQRGVLPGEYDLVALSTVGIVVLSLGVLVEGWAMVTSFLQEESEANAA